MPQHPDWVADVVGLAFGLGIGGVATLVRRSKASARRRPQWAAGAGVQGGGPVQLTDQDVWLRRPGQPKHGDWRHGRLVISPASVQWRPSSLPRTPVDLTHAGQIHSRANNLSTDWQLFSGQWPVLVMQAGGETLEVSGPAPALGDLMSRLQGAPQPDDPAGRLSPGDDQQADGGLAPS
jgi:hypothetical protein